MTRPRALRALSWTAVACTYVLVVLGGVVRVTGSGMGCGDDWPLCHGRLLPPLDLPTLIEYGHRLAASLVSLLVLGLVVLAWTDRGGGRGLRRPAALAAALLAVQVLLGALTVKLGLPPASVVLHFATAMLLLAVLIAGALRASTDPPAARAGTAVRRLASASAAAAFATVLLGGLVANLHAGPACEGFPLCNGAILPQSDARAQLHAAHRLAAYALVGFVFATWVAALRERRASSAPFRWACAALAVAVAQVAIAAAMVLSVLPPAWRVAHMAAGSLLWTAVVGLVVSARREPAGRTGALTPQSTRPPAPAPAAARRRERRDGGVAAPGSAVR